MEPLPEPRPLSETQKELADASHELIEQAAELRDSPIEPIQFPPIPDPRFGTKRPRD